MSPTDLSIIAPSPWLDEETLDALVETVDGLVQGVRNVGIAVTASMVTQTTMSAWQPQTNFDAGEREAERQHRLKRRLVSETDLRLKLKAGFGVTPRDVLDCENQTLKHRALVACGYERFVEEVGATVVDTDGENSLILVQQHNTQRPIVFVYVKDATGDKRYLLRVPPEMRRVREAIAWTFGLRERDYQPEKET